MMRKTATLLLLTGALMATVAANTLRFDRSEALSFSAIVEYSPDAQGLYHAVNPFNFDDDLIGQPYAFDPKTSHLYVSTPQGNYVLCYDKKQSARFRKDKDIPHLTGEKLHERVVQVNVGLKNYYADFNRLRLAFMADSIEQARQDSIRYEQLRREHERRQDSVRQATRRAFVADYRSKADSHTVIDRSGRSLSCIYCEETTPWSDVYITSINGDSIAYRSRSASPEDQDFPFHHVYVATGLAEKDNSWNDYLMAYGDTMAHRLPALSEEVYEGLLKKKTERLKANLRKKAPYGIVTAYDWNDDYGTLTFELTYFNTAPKTLKYIQIDVALYNPVGDLRNTYTFRGTGPVATWQNGAWDWDNTLCFLAGDVSTLSIRKITLTYMDGSKRVLTGNNIIITDSEE